MDKPTLEEYLAGVKGRCEKATKGPWMAEGHCIAAKVDGGRPNGEVIARMSGSADHLTSAQRIANAELAAHSRTDVEALVGMVEAFLTYLEETDGEWHPLNNLHNKLDTLIPPAKEDKP